MSMDEIDMFLKLYSLCKNVICFKFISYLNFHKKIVFLQYNTLQLFFKNTNIKWEYL